jgi:acid phosphatase class B
MSCEYFNVKKTSSEAILKEELQTFNWNEVDEYPSFSICDSSATKLVRKQCFETILTTHIKSSLQKDTIVISQDIEDTLLLQLQISETGILSLVNLKVDSITNQEIPNIKELLIKGLDSLPKIFPALKRGQQVKTEFKLPVIIHVN